MISRNVAFSFLLILWIKIVLADANLTSYCTGESFHAQCPDQHLILMERAVYGRIGIGRCIKTDMGYLNCNADVLDIADSLCSGRRTCEIRIPSAMLDRRLSCLNMELTRHMESSYTCVPVEHLSTKNCSSYQGVTVTQQMTNLASLVTNETGCGNESAPWVLEAQPGQQIEVTLLDFGWQNRSTLPQPGSDCPKRYGKVVDLTTGSMNDICGGGSTRSKIIMRSSGHRAQLVLEQAAVKHTTLLVQYRALGCPDLNEPPGSIMQRDGDTLVIECKKTRQSWHLRCTSVGWSGVIGNCTQHEVRMQQLSQNPNHSLFFSTELLVAMILLCALSACGAILAVGFLIIKRSNPPFDYSKPAFYGVKSDPDAADPGYARHCLHSSGTYPLRQELEATNDTYQRPALNIDQVKREKYDPMIGTNLIGNGQKHSFPLCQVHSASLKVPSSEQAQFNL